VKRILLTGAGLTGFVGRNLFEDLRGKYLLFTPSSRELDLRDYEKTAAYVDHHGIEAIVHAASQSKDVFQADLRMYFNLEKVSRNLDRMVYFGSGAEFDKRDHITMAREEDFGRRIPTDDYGFAKYIMTAHARGSANIYNLRLFGVFGKYEDWTAKFISNLCCKAVYGLLLSIRRECLFDFIYVQDIAKVVEWFLENKPTYHDYNLVYGNPVKLTELAKSVIRTSGRNHETVVLNEGMGLDYTAGNERLRGELPWFVPTPLDDAIETLYQYYEGHKTEIDVAVLRGTR
jgi:GDP-L-fucose synthase